MNVRLPRVIAVILIGAPLELSGAAYQGVFQNPLALPTSWTCPTAPASATPFLFCSI
ncbi:MAG: iron chelate uptake ABC transporter family permease subunit [Eggerthellaceae bacterium]|nr:iron chelate uptake ABC transporter family permease subunit [Eggerthellaceae bacterium]